MTPDAGRLAETLEQILTALELNANARQREQLIELVLLLHRWNSTYNLTAVRDLDAMMIQHLADCLAVVPSLTRRIGVQAVPTLLDVGSGAGFPGSVIAIMQPSLRVTCIDSVGKKAAFIRQTAGALGLPNLVAEQGRVQSFRSEPFQLITARALSDLPLFVRMTAHLLAADGCWMAMKGRNPGLETGKLAAIDIAFHVEQLKVPMLEAERCLVWMTRQSKS